MGWSIAPSAARLCYRAWLMLVASPSDLHCHPRHILVNMQCTNNHPRYLSGTSFPHSITGWRENLGRDGNSLRAWVRSLELICGPGAHAQHAPQKIEGLYTTSLMHLRLISAIELRHRHMDRLHCHVLQNLLIRFCISSWGPLGRQCIYEALRKLSPMPVLNQSYLKSLKAKTDMPGHSWWERIEGSNPYSNTNEWCALDLQRPRTFPKIAPELGKCAKDSLIATIRLDGLTTDAFHELSV